MVKFAVSTWASSPGDRMDRTGGKLSMIGGLLHSLLRPRQIGLPYRLALVEGVEHPLDNVGSGIFVAEFRSREEVGGFVPAAIDMPADQILAARRGHVVARRRPGDPGLGLAVDEEREQLGAIGPAQPADRAVAICGDNDAAVS